MKSKLLIIGAGNVGGFLSYNIDEFGSYDILGFLDDDQEKHNTKLYGKQVLGGIDKISELSQIENVSVAIGISSPKARYAMAKKLSNLNLQFPNFISKNVWISKHVEFGKGNIIYPGVSINYESRFGDFIIMNMNCAVGHNAVIESYTTLAPGVNLGGYTHIEQKVNVGIGVSTRQFIRVGHSSVIGGQSMLVKDVLPQSVVKGVPGRTS